MSGTGGAHAAPDVAEILAALHLIPHDARDHEVSWEQAVRTYLLPLDVLETMVAGGLAKDGPGGPFLDHFDLLNVALELRIVNIWTYGPDAWGRLLRKAAGRPSMPVEIEPIPECSGEEHDGDECSFRVRFPSGWRRYTADDAPVMRFDLPTSWPPPGSAAAELIDEFGRLRFVRLPTLVGADGDFVRRTGVADCNGAARLMADEGRRRGLNCRLAQGLILSPPFSIMHYWTEMETDGIWVPHDPLIVNALLRWGILDGEEWDIYRSTGAILARLTGNPGPVALDHGEPTGASFATSLPNKTANEPETAP